MCGIAGIVDTTRPVEREVLERMVAAMRHRGPDAHGIWMQPPSADGQAPGVGLAHARLSIIDLDAGRQPMSNDDGSVCICFNGEIYNFQELRRELEARGHRFRTRSDTEVIIRSYEAFGEACVTKFRGMFAFAIWDARQQRLLLARDRVGKKPLVYAERGGRFAFASELRALLQAPWIERQLDESALHDYLTFMCVPAPRTMFAGINKLPPAHCLSLERGQVRVWRYWDLPFTPKLQIGADEATEELLRLLEEAVRLRLVSDVPLGALLSGGMDSSTIVALMAKHSSRPVKTFSIGFHEAQFNELPYARMVARHFGTEHHEEIVTPDAVEILPQLVDHYGEPFADSSAVPSFYLARMARQHVTVVLNGDGGDEAFGGYYRHIAMRWADRYGSLPSLVRRAAESGPVRLVAKRITLHRARLNADRFLQTAGRPRSHRLARWMGCFTDEMKASLYGPAMRDTAQPPSHTQLDPWLEGTESLDGVDAALRTDTLFYLPNDLLVKMDIAAMAHGLEARSPLLDHAVLEFAARLPASMKVRGAHVKWLLKRAQRGILPPPILKRPKQGFSVPVDEWFRGALGSFARETLLSRRAVSRGYFDARAVERLFEDHRRQRAQYGHHLWVLVMFELWHQRFIDTTVGFEEEADVALSRA